MIERKDRVMPTLTIDLLLRARAEIEALKTKLYVHPKNEHRIKEVSIQVKLDPLMPENIVAFVSPDGEWLGWIDFEKSQAFMLTQETREKFKRQMTLEIPNCWDLGNREMKEERETK